MVFDAFAAFDPKFAELARRVFDQNHLDSEIRKGKDSGAFCASVVPEMTPYVLLNYQGRARDVATMAHELGHAIHSMLAEEHSTFTFQASLPLAETASTFGEMMLTDKLLAEETDEAVRKEILFKQMDDAYRQPYCARRTSRYSKNRRTSWFRRTPRWTKSLQHILKTLKEQFGDSLELSEEFKWEWVDDPAHLSHAVLCVCLRLWTIAGAFPLSAIQIGRRVVQAEVS